MPQFLGNQTRKPKPMAYGGGPFGLPDEEYDLRFPQMPDEMDPTALPPMPRPPAELSRFDAEPMPEMGGSPQAPPQMDALMADEDRSMRDTAPPPMGQQAPPPMGKPLRNQGARQQQYLDYMQQVLTDPKHPGQMKKPSILQDVLGAVAPRINWHPNLTREYQNLGVLKEGADEERKMQQAQANEQIKNDTLDTNRETRLASQASRQAAGRPAQTIAERIREAQAAVDATGQPIYTPDEIKMIGAGWRPPVEKPEARPNVAPGHGVWNPEKKAYEVPVPAVDKPLVEHENPNQWIADAQNPDPAISGPAKQKLAAWQKTQKQPIVNVNAMPSDAALDQAATRYLKTGELPALGMGRDAAAARTRILNRAAELDPTADISGNKAAYGADKGSLAQLQRTRDAVNAFEGTARKNLDRFLDVAQKTVDTGMPWVNNAFRGGARMLGDPNAAQFEAARTVAFTEIAKVLNNPTSSAVLSDSARKEAEAVLSGNYSVKQLMQVAQLLKSDMENRKAETDRALGEIQGRISGKKPAAAVSTPQLGQVKEYQGHQYKFDGSQWVRQ